MQLIPRLRFHILIFSSALFLFSNSMLGSIYLYLVIIASYGFTKLSSKKKASFFLTVLFVMFQIFFLLTNKSTIHEYKLIFFSYICLQLIAHYVDVVWYKIEMLTFYKYILANSLFLNITSGPLENPKNLVEKIKLLKINRNGLADGACLIISGLFKKTLADTIFELQLNILANKPDTGNAIISILFLMSRIYCDFSGYTDIVRGSALIMGFELNVNFENPYLSTNIVEFWSKWHMSLSDWFKKYIFNPLYLNLSRSNFPETLSFFISISSVFVLIGLWHQLSIKFLYWSLLNIILTCAYLLFAKKIYLPRFFSWLATMFIVFYLQLIAHTTANIESNNNFLKTITLSSFTNNYTLQSWFFCLVFFIVPIFFDYIMFKTKKYSLYFLVIIYLEFITLFLLKPIGKSFIYGQY